MKRSLATAVVIQGSGAVLGILTVFAVSRLLGTREQGLFATYKNWFDIVSVVLLLGIPQGMIYAINQTHMSSGYAARMSLRISAGSLPVILLVNLVEAQFGYLEGATPLWLYGLIPLGIGGYIYHGLARSVLLTNEDGAVFSLLSALPTVGIAAILAIEFLVAHPRMETVFSINGLVCGALAWVSLRRFGQGKAVARPGWQKVLARQSGHFFVQSVLSALQPFLVFALLRTGAGGLPAVGLFSFSLVALVSANSLIGMLAPILYNHWSKPVSGDARRHLRGVILWLSVGLGALFAMLLIVAAPFVPLLVGSQFASAVATIRILALAVIPLLFTRLAQPALMATNRTHFATLIGVARLCCVIALTALFSTVVGATVSWVAGEYLAALILLRLVWHSTEATAVPIATSDFQPPRSLS